MAPERKLPQSLEKRLVCQKTGLQANLRGHFSQRQRVKNREIRILAPTNQLALNYVTDSGKSKVIRIQPIS